MIKCNKCNWTITRNIYDENEELFITMCMNHALRHQQEAFIKKNFHIVTRSKKKKK